MVLQRTTPLCIAHRGFSGKYPENTMLAFKKAIEAGCGGIELDVHLTRDNEIVVIHDETVDRTTDGRGAVKDFTLQELRFLNAGCSFPGCSEKIPTLREYFELVKNLPILTNIELKNSEYYYEGLEEKTIQIVREFHLEDSVVFSSFNNASIMLCRQLAPEIKGGFLCDKPVQNCGSYASFCGIAYIHPNYSQITEGEISSCHAKGVGLNLWTVNEPEAMRRFIRLGVQGIITNHPDICSRILKEEGFTGGT